MSDLNPYEEGLAIDLALAESRIEELEEDNKRLRLEVAHANDTADAAIERAKELETLIKELFRLLDITEQTDEGRLFRPNRIYSRRALDAEKLEKVLSDLKAMIGETDE